MKWKSHHNIEMYCFICQALQCSTLFFHQVCDPSDGAFGVTWPQRAFLLQGLAGSLATHPGQGLASPEVLLEVTFSLSEVLRSPPGPYLSKADSDGGHGAVAGEVQEPASSSRASDREHSQRLGLAGAVAGLAKLLVLHEGQVSTPLGNLDWEESGLGHAPHPPALQGAEVTTSKPIWEALSQSLASVASASAPLVGDLGPQGAADLVSACAVFAGGVPWEMVKVGIWP